LDYNNKKKKSYLNFINISVPLLFFFAGEKKLKEILKRLILLNLIRGSCVCNTFCGKQIIIKNVKKRLLKKFEWSFNFIDGMG
jgi:hypothetical protein